MVSFKTTAGAIAIAHMQTFRIISFQDTFSGRLRVDTSATPGGKQDPSKQGRRVILIYNFHIYYKASLDPKKCTHKSDEKAKRIWINAHLEQVDQYADVNNPPRNPQEDETMEDKAGETEQRQHQT